MMDGVSHINVYSKGKTELGRLLSNFAHTPFEIEDERFESVEGWWYWRQCGDDQLCNLYGYKAKKIGSVLTEGLDFPDPTEEELLQVYHTKLLYNSDLAKLFVANKLPYDHYYVYGDKVVFPKHRWTGQLWNRLNDARI